MKQYLSIIILFGILSSVSVFGQKEFKKLEETENVVFYYKWKPSKFLKKDSPLVLILRIENQNAHAINISFSTDYFWDGIRKATSDDQEYCIKANKKIKGKLKGLGFDTSVFSNDQIMNSRFQMEVNGIEIKEVDNCFKK